MASDRARLIAESGARKDAENLEVWAAWQLGKLSETNVEERHCNNQLTGGIKDNKFRQKWARQLLQGLLFFIIIFCLEKQVYSALINQNHVG